MSCVLENIKRVFFPGVDYRILAKTGNQTGRSWLLLVLTCYSCSLFDSDFRVGKFCFGGFLNFTFLNIFASRLTVRGHEALFHAHIDFL